MHIIIWIGITSLEIEQVPTNEYTSKKVPEEENGNPLQVFLPGELHDQMSLVGYRPWDHKELGMSEQLTYTKEGATKG